MTLEEARDALARNLVAAGDFHGLPNRFYPRDLYACSPMLAGRIGKRFCQSLQDAMNRIDPEIQYRVAYDRFLPNQPKSFYVQFMP